MEKSQPEISNQQLFAKLLDVEKLLTTPKIEKGLWSMQDIADYCGLSYGHVSTFIIADPKFPAPVNIPSSRNGRPKRLFIREDVINFFAKNKQKKISV